MPAFDPARATAKNAAMATAPAQTTLTRPALAVLCATIFSTVAMSSMSSITLPDIAQEFDVSADTLSWVVTAYLIPFATGTMVYGRLADMFGTRRMYLFGLGLFAVASFAVALAPGFPFIIAARALQGAGGTAMPALSLATIIRTTAPLDRGRAMGATVLTVGLGFATGPLLGGVLTDAMGWPGPYLAAGIIATAVFPLAIALIPRVAGVPGQRFDVVGAALVVGAVTGAVIALNRLPRHPVDAFGYAGLSAAVVLGAVLVAWLRRAPAPFIHPEVARNVRFWGLSGVGMGGQGVHFAVIVLLPILMTRHFGLDNIEVGLWLLPGALCIAVFGMTGGYLLNRLGARALLVSGSGVMAGGAVLLHLWGVDWRPAGLALCYVVVATGYGLIQSAVITAATGALPERLAGLASGSFNLAFFLGGAISVALASAILRGREGATASLDPLFMGDRVDFSDAMLVVVGLSLLALVLAVRFSPPRE